jgi:hypothetical protein
MEPSDSMGGLFQSSEKITRDFLRRLVQLSSRHPEAASRKAYSVKSLSIMKEGSISLLSHFFQDGPDPLLQAKTFEGGSLLHLPEIFFKSLFSFSKKLQFPSFSICNLQFEI